MGEKVSLFPLLFTKKDHFANTDLWVKKYTLYSIGGATKFFWELIERSRKFHEIFVNFATPTPIPSQREIMTRSKICVLDCKGNQRYLFNVVRNQIFTAIALPDRLKYSTFSDSMLLQGRFGYDDSSNRKQSRSYLRQENEKTCHCLDNSFVFIKFALLADRDYCSMEIFPGRQSLVRYSYSS